MKNILSRGVIPIKQKDLLQIQSHIKNIEWTLINNSVYDLTNFIDKHPGGDIIKISLGNNSTELFYSVHGPKTEKYINNFLLKTEIDIKEEPSIIHFRNLNKLIWNEISSNNFYKHLNTLSQIIPFVLQVLYFVLHYTIFVLNYKYATIPLAYCEMALISCAHSLGHRSTFKSNRLGVFITYLCEVMHSGLCGPRQKIVYKGMEYDDICKDVASNHGYWSAEHPIMHHLFVNKQNDMEGSAKNTIEGNLPFTDTHAVRLWSHSKKSFIHKYQHILWLIYALYYRFTKYIRIHFFLVPKFILNIYDTKETLTWQMKYQKLIMTYIGIPRMLCVWYSLYNSTYSTLFNILLYSIAFEFCVGFQTTLWSLHKINTNWMKKQDSVSDSWLDMQLQTVSYWIHQPFSLIMNIIFSGFFAYHIEHHLFPRLNWLYLPYIAPIVKNYLESNGYVYTKKKLSIIGFPRIGKEYIHMLKSTSY